MKLILSIIIFLFLSTKIFSQETSSTNKTVFLDSLWNETTDENYKYIRVIERYYTNQKTYVYKDYYKSKILQMIGKSSDKDVIREEGQYLYYYENGNKKTSTNYASGRHTGREFNWYEDGTLKSEIEYFKDKKGETKYKINNYWNPQHEQTVIKGNGFFEDIDKSYQRSGKLKDGLPEGVWKGKNSTCQCSYVENFENGKLISGVSIDSSKTEHNYSIIRQKASPKKGINSFYKYVAHNIKIPLEVQQNVSGQIFMNFAIDKEGNLIEPKILKGIGYGLDEQVIALIKGAEKWNPELERGIPIRINYSFPITFAKNNQ